MSAFTNNDTRTSSINRNCDKFKGTLNDNFRDTLEYDIDFAKYENIEVTLKFQWKDDAYWYDGHDIVDIMSKVRELNSRLSNPLADMEIQNTVEKSLNQRFYQRKAKASEKK